MHTGKETDFSKIILYFFTYLRRLPEGCDTFWPWKKSGFFSLLLFNQSYGYNSNSTLKTVDTVSITRSSILVQMYMVHYESCNCSCKSRSNCQDFVSLLHLQMVFYNCVMEPGQAVVLAFYGTRPVI